MAARITDPWGLELEVVTPLVVTASEQRLMGRLSLTQKRQAHMSEAHLGYYHRLSADDSVSEVKLLYVFVQGVAQPVWRNVATLLAVSHESVGLVESSQTTHITLGCLAFVP